MYNQFRSAIKPSFRDPRICPICNLTDQAVNVMQLLKSQMTHQPDGNWLITNLGESLLALDPRPQIKLINGFHNEDDIRNWDRAAERRGKSFYCSRCNEVFFTEDGIKYHDSLSNFKQLLYFEQ
jgi:hypothetical protein